MFLRWHLSARERVSEKLMFEQNWQQLVDSLPSSKAMVTQLGALDPLAAPEDGGGFRAFSPGDAGVAGRIVCKALFMLFLSIVLISST